MFFAVVVMVALAIAAFTREVLPGPEDLAGVAADEAALPAGALVVSIRQLAALPDGTCVRLRGRARAARGLADAPHLVARRDEIDDWVSERAVPFELGEGDDAAWRTVPVDVRRSRLLPAPSGARSWRLRVDDEVLVVGYKAVVHEGPEAAPDLPGGPFRTLPDRAGSGRPVVTASTQGPVYLRPVK